MIFRNLTLLILLFSTSVTYAQNCDCNTNFEWVKKTFEENDAGFQYIVKSKGEQTYTDHNKRILEKVQKAKSLSECSLILYEWLTFFRSGHIAISLNQQSQPAVSNKLDDKILNWESTSINTDDFKKFLDQKKNHDYEGIWESAPYTIGIKKMNDEYIGFIIESGVNNWTKGQIKLKLTVAEDHAKSVVYMRDHSASESEIAILTGKNRLQVGSLNLTRVYPKVVDEPIFEQYFKMLNSNQPYLDKLNSSTLYLRIPSFDESFKSAIDSILKVNNQTILNTKNLIIDIRNNGGGSDLTYRSLTPYLYTNPIRTVGVEFLSTKLNNQRMLELVNNPDFDEEFKNWAKKAFDKLETKLGQFVNLNDQIVSEKKENTIHKFPENVGIIINEANGSSAEQFLLEAKQSKKVKLFGVTTFGVLDISNMHFVESPCKQFQLGYALSRSMRIPNFTIDEKGIQPDYFIDKGIPNYQWTEYVNKILNSN